MKRIYIAMTLLACTSFLVSASGLEVTEYPFDVRKAYYPIWDARFQFGQHVSLGSNTVATVLHEGEVIAYGTVSVSNYTGGVSGEIIGFADVTFETPLVLPKGESYTMVVEKDAVTAVDDPRITNDEIRYDFEIPSDIGPARFDNGQTISTAKSLWFYWSTETEPLGEPYALLYREGKLVREYPLHVSWDWDLGQAYVDLGGDTHFEKGVQFSVVIPEGLICAWQREDITNNRVEVSFIGAYEEPLPSLHYYWCSLYDNHPDGVIGEVSFFYDREIVLSLDPVLQLVEDDSEVVMEAVPTLVEKDGEWILTADFNNYPMKPSVGYSIVIPEGTVIAGSGDPVFNSRSTVILNGGSGIDEVRTGDDDSDAPLYDLFGRKVVDPQPGTICIQSGKKILIKYPVH